MLFKKGHKFYSGGEVSWFKKGNIPHNKGVVGKYISSEEKKAKQSRSLKIAHTIKKWGFKKGHIPERAFKKGMIPWNKGKVGIRMGWSKGLTKENNNSLKQISIKQTINCSKPEYKALIKLRRSKQVFPLNDTSIELKIQSYLKQLGYDFFTHQYIKSIKHGYQCDILIPSLNLIIECDGDYWHKYPIGKELDHIRTSELLSNGFKVLRLWEHEIKFMENPKQLDSRIDLAIRSS